MSAADTTTPARLELDPEWFLAQAIRVLGAQRALLVDLCDELGPTHRVEAIAPDGDTPITATVRDELERCDAAIREIEAQRAGESAESAASSYCSVCDALEGECDHQAHRYAPDTVYEPVHNEEGELVGWKLSAGDQAILAELDRQRANGAGPYMSKPPAQQPTQEAKPLQQIVVELYSWVDMDDRLEGELRRTYEADALRVTRIAAQVIQGCEAKRVYNAGGLLRALLRRLPDST